MYVSILKSMIILPKVMNPTMFEFVSNKEAKNWESASDWSKLALLNSRRAKRKMQKMSRLSVFCLNSQAPTAQRANFSITVHKAGPKGKLLKYIHMAQYFEQKLTS